MSDGHNAQAEFRATDDLVVVARTVKTRGVRGEVAAELLTDFPERFTDIKHLIAVSTTGERATLTLESYWLHGGRVILKFAGYDTIEAAEPLVGYDLAVPEAECVKLAEDEFYDWQLTGCAVETVEGASVGCVIKVWHTSGTPVLIVEDTQTKHEHLIPLAGAICVEIDTTRKLIRVDPPEGLLEF